MTNMINTTSIRNLWYPTQNGPHRWHFHNSSQIIAGEWITNVFFTDTRLAEYRVTPQYALAQNSWLLQSDAQYHVFSRLTQSWWRSGDGNEMLPSIEKWHIRLVYAFHWLEQFGLSYLVKLEKCNLPISWNRREPRAGK